MTAAHRALLAPGIVEREILVLRGHRVILDEQLAPYGVEVKVLNQAVKRNRENGVADQSRTATCPAGQCGQVGVGSPCARRKLSLSQ